MPGAWELPHPSVLVSILTRETVTTAWAAAFRNLQIPPGGGIRWSYGAPFDPARNACCGGALEGGFEYVFFLDDDIITPPDVISRLMARRLPIVSGTYFRRNSPFAPVAQVRDAQGLPCWLMKFDLNQLIEVDHVGAGCLLLHRSIFDKIKPPWFEWRCDRFDFPPHLRTSEDFAFCEKAQEVGYKVILDTGVQCIHAGLASSNIEGMKPLIV